MVTAGLGSAGRDWGSRLGKVDAGRRVSDGVEDVSRGHRIFAVVDGTNVTDTLDLSLAFRSSESCKDFFPSSALGFTSCSLSDEEDEESADDELDWLSFDLDLVAENFSFNPPCELKQAMIWLLESGIIQKDDAVDFTVLIIIPESTT